MRAWCRKCEAEREVPFSSSPADRGCEVCGGMLVSLLEKDRKPIKRQRSRNRPPLSSVPRKRERIWTLARDKVELEGICRLARLEDCVPKLDAAHVIGRDRDQFRPLDPGLLDPWLAADTRSAWLVVPDRVIPLCRHHHVLYDAGAVGLLGRLESVEELQAVADSHTEGTRESGIELARKRIEAPAYLERAA